MRSVHAVKGEKMGKLILAFVVGLMVGGMFGFFVAALLAASRKGD